jgi:hypothetical protein
MKKAMLIFLVTMFAASYAYAGPRDYVGLFFDTTPGHSICRYDNTGDFSVYYYVWAKPAFTGAYPGLYAIEFKIVFPPMVYDFGSLTLNAGINLTLGDILVGWSATFASCQPAGTWVQIYRQRVYCDTTIEPDGVIQITETDDSHNLGLADCDMVGQSLTVLNHAHINVPCIIGTKDASWGAIKNLF